TTRTSGSASSSKSNRSSSAAGQATPTSTGAGRRFATTPPKDSRADGQSSTNRRDGHVLNRKGESSASSKIVVRRTGAINDTSRRILFLHRSIVGRPPGR